METSPPAGASLNLLGSQHIHLSPQLSNSRVKVSQAGMVSVQFYKVILLTGSLGEASPLRNRSGSRRKVCKEWFLIYFKPRHLQVTEFCRWCTERENLGELSAFTKNISPDGEDTRAIV